MQSGVRLAPCCVAVSALYVCAEALISARRYFLRKLRKVKKANGQILACNEVRLQRAL